MKSKRQRFVEEYLIDLNATQAAIRSGHRESSARVRGHQLLKLPDVAAAAAALAAVRKTRSESGRVTTTTVELHDKVAALEMLGRHLGLFAFPGWPGRLALPELTVTIVRGSERQPPRSPGDARSK